MVTGINTFKEYFAGYENQYVLIGGAACDIIFSNNNASFRATRDLDMVLIVEALTSEFAEHFWNFIADAEYRHITSSTGEPQFYRFDKPQKDEYPKMIELFSRTQFELKEAKGLTPIHIDDDIESLSAILLDDDYYQVLLSGKTVENGLSVLRPEYLIIFKAKAFLDLKIRKENGEQIDSSNIRKHKNDILRITVEMLLKAPTELPEKVRSDMNEFIDTLDSEPFDQNLLKNYGLKSDDVKSQLKRIMNIQN